jgi:hypothetical protein
MFYNLSLSRELPKADGASGFGATRGRRERENARKKNAKPVFRCGLNSETRKKNGSRNAEKKSMTERLETSFFSYKPSESQEARDKFIFSPLLLHFFFRFN